MVGRDWLNKIVLAAIVIGGLAIFAMPNGVAWGQQQPPPDYNTWANGPDKKDLNGDGKIDEADYQIFLSNNPPPTSGDQTGQTGQTGPDFNTWVSSPGAKDLNGDGKIDEADFKIFLSNNPPPASGDQAGQTGQPSGSVPQGAPVVVGSVTTIDPAGSFTILSNAGVSEKILVTDTTQFFKNPSQPNGGDTENGGLPPNNQPGQSGQGTASFGQTQPPQNQPGSQPGQAGQTGSNQPGQTGAGGTPAKFGDLKVGDIVDVFGERNPDGVIVATYVGISINPVSPGGPGLSPEVINVLDEIKQQLASGSTSVDITPFLSKLPDDNARALLTRLAGDDGLLTLDEIARALGGSQPGTGGSGQPGTGGNGAPVVSGKVTGIDQTGQSFTVVAGDGSAVTVQVTDATQFFFNPSPAGPDPSGGQAGQPGQGTTSFGQTQQPPQNQPGQTGQPGTNQPGQPGQTGPNGTPAKFGDLKVGDVVDVFGNKNADGTIAAISVGISVNGGSGNVEISFSGTYENGTLHLDINTPKWGPLSFDFTVSADGMSFGGSATSQAGLTVAATFARVDGAGGDDLTGAWSGTVLNVPLTLQIKQDGTTITGIVKGTPSGTGGQPGSGNMGAPVISASKVKSIDSEGQSFTVEAEDGSVTTVQVTNATQFFIRLNGGPGGSQPDQPGGQPNQPATGTSALGQTQPGQPGGQSGQPGNQPGPGGAQSDQPGGPSGQPGGSPNYFEGTGSFADLKVDDQVEIFGQSNTDTKVVAANAVRIIRAFDNKSFGFPIASGQVTDINTGGNTFSIDEGPGLSATVHITDATQFFIQQENANGPQPGNPDGRNSSGGNLSSLGQTQPGGPSGQPGNQQGQPGGIQSGQPGSGPVQQPAKFADLKAGDDVDIFGSIQEGGDISADKIVIFRKPQEDVPVTYGPVSNLNASARTLTVRDAETHDEWAVTANDSTVVTLINDGPSNGSNIGGPAYPNPQKLQEDSNGNNGAPGSAGPSNQNNGNPDQGQPNPGQPGQPAPEVTRSFDAIQNGMSVAVFGDANTDAKTIAATRIVILYGGATQQPFDVSGRIDFYDQFGGMINFQPPALIFVQQPLSISFPDGSASTSLNDLLTYFVNLAKQPDADPKASRMLVDLLPSADPNHLETNSVRVLSATDDPTVGDNQRLVAVNDPKGQVRTGEQLISLPNKPSVRVTRNTQITLGGSSAGPEALNAGVRIHVTGTKTVYPGGQSGEHVADKIDITGGTPFSVNAPVASVDEANHTVTLEADSPEPLNKQVYVGDTHGRPISLSAFADQLAANPDYNVIVRFNPYGSGVIRLELVDPKSPRLLRQEDAVFPAGEISVDVAQQQLVFKPKPPISVPDGTPIVDDAGTALTLADLPGKRVIISGELVGSTPTADQVTVVQDVASIHIQVEVGDFDGEGAADDARLRVYKGDTQDELGVPVTAFLDFNPPEQVNSGAVANNLAPGVHRVTVDVPSLPGVEAHTSFVIRERAAGLTVVSTTPEDGASGVSDGAGTVSITFSSPIQVAGQFVNVKAFLRPGKSSGMLRDLSLSSDGLTVTAPITLDAGVTYTLTIVNAVGANKSDLKEPVTVTFSTGNTVALLGTIKGTVNLKTLAAGKLLAADSTGAEILSGTVIAVGDDGEQAGQGVVDSTGAYEIKVPEGSYDLYARIETTEGITSGHLDNVTVSAGSVAVAPEFDVPAPVNPSSVGSADLVSNAGEASPVKMDLDPISGNQGMTLSQAAPGDVISLAVYIDGVKDLAGYELQMQYDSTAVSLVNVSDDGSSEKNILKQNGGFAASFTTLHGNIISQTSAILGPTDAQLGQGDGLLGVFTFRVGQRFYGTTDLVATQVLLSAPSGATDTVQAFSRAQVEVAGLTRQLSVSASRDTLSSTGSDASVLTVKLYDLDGIAYSADDTSQVTFEVTSNNGQVNGGKSATVTASKGQATATVKATGEGDITVLTSLSGARPVQTVIAVPAPPAIGEGPVGPVALDLNLDAGDQQVRTTSQTPAVGDTVAIDLVATEGISGMAGYQVTVQYDPAQLSFDSQSGFAVAGLFAGAVPIVTTGSGTVQASVAFLGGSTATSDAGSIGQFTFTVAGGYTGKTRVTLISGQYGSVSGQTKLTIGSGGASVQIGADNTSGGSGGSTAASPDLDGDGSVGFSDFLLFAGAFGKSSGKDGYLAKADLDGDGTIGFADFLQFAGAFGKPVSGKAAGRAKPVGMAPGANAETQLSLTPVASRSADQALVAVHLMHAVDVRGYDLHVTFDPTALELAGVSGPQGSVFGTNGVAVQTDASGGDVLLADVLGPDAAVQGDQNLVVLRFQVLDPTAVGRVDVAQALVSDGADRINTLVGAHLDDVHALPKDYALGQNYPNPFNPETAVPFALPVSGNVRVGIYNILGQEVATLVDGYRSAGFYRLVWNGKDALGRQVASGIYFVRMVSGDFARVHKMLLLK